MTSPRSTPRLVADLARRTVQAMVRTRRRLPPRTERVTLVLAAIVFIATAAVGFSALPEAVSGVRWMPLLLLALAVVPVMVVINSLEFLVSAQMLGLPCSLGAALRVSVVASAANLLPLPGAALIKVRALTGLGTSIAKAAGATAGTAVVWFATTSLLTGALRFMFGVSALAVGLVVGGLVALGMALLIYRQVDAGGRPVLLLSRTIAIEAATVLTTGVQFYLVFSAIGRGIGFADAIMFSIPVLLSSAVGFLPGGLGLRELLSGATAPLIGVSPAVGIVVATIDRLVTMIPMSLIAGSMAARRSRGGRIAQPLDGREP